MSYEVKLRRLEENKLEKFIEDFLKSKLYGELWKKGWRLMYGKTVDDLCRRAGQIPRKYIPKGAKGFVSATDIH